MLLVTHDHRLAEAAPARVQRRTIGIILLDDDHNEVLRWYRQDAWIARFELSELGASKNEVAIETIELDR